MPSILNRLKIWAYRVKGNGITLWIAAQDDRTPLFAKLVATAVAAYAFSPIDLIPDFIPILGYLDDLLILPLGIALAIRLIPRPLMAEFRARASELAARPRSIAAAVAIASLWLVALVVFGLWLRRRVSCIQLNGRSNSHITRFQKRKMGAGISAGPHFRRVSRSASLSGCDHRTRRAMCPPERLSHRVGFVLPTRMAVFPQPILIFPISEIRLRAYRHLLFEDHPVLA